MSNKKYYWLKLKRDFFKRHDTMIIEGMENGKDYLLFYLKLLVESIDHDGELRFSDTIPYNEKMLSIITNTNVDIVRSAVTVLTELNLIEKLEDGTIFMNQVELMIGSETNKAESMRKLRAQKTEEVTLLPDVTESSDQLPECYTEKELEKEIEKDINNTKKPVRHKYGKYHHVLLTDKNVCDLKNKFGEHKTEYLINLLDEGIQLKGYPYKDHYLAILNWEKRDKDYKPPIFKNNKQTTAPMPPEKCPVCKTGIVIPVTYGAAQCMSKECKAMLNYLPDQQKWVQT